MFSAKEEAERTHGSVNGLVDLRLVIYTAGVCVCVCVWGKGNRI